MFSPVCIYEEGVRCLQDHTISHYMKLGAERSKLVLGIPTYGRSYTLFNPLATDLGSPADGPGEQGDSTREKGYLAYYEVMSTQGRQQHHLNASTQLDCPLSDMRVREERRLEYRAAIAQGHGPLRLQGQPVGQLRRHRHHQEEGTTNTSRSQLQIYATNTPNFK